MSYPYHFIIYYALLIECVVPLHNSTHVVVVLLTFICLVYLRNFTSVPLPCITDNDMTCIATETLLIDSLKSVLASSIIYSQN